VRSAALSAAHDETAPARAAGATPSFARCLTTFGALGAGAVLLVGLAVRPERDVGFAAVALVTLLVLTVIVGRALAADGDHGRPLGAATLLTLARGLALAPLAGLVAVAPSPGVAAYAPFVLYGCSAVADGLDGWLARVSGTTSRLGARLDTAFDALGMLVGPAVAVAHGRLPRFYLAVGVTYYLMVGAIALRRALGAPVYPERNVPRAARRLFAGLHMALVTAALAPPTSPAVAAVVAAVFAPPLVLDLAVTIPVTLGWLAPAPYRRLTRLATSLAFVVLPLAARVVAVGAAVLADGLPVPVRALGAATVLGVGARSCAMAALVVAALSQADLTSVAATVLLTCAAVVAYLGSGPLSPRRGDDRLLLTRPGERA